jgi:trehalose utilization protein
MIKAVVWNEYLHERENPAVRDVYPDGIHAAIAAALAADPGIAPETATLDEPEHGLPEARLAATDVLIWWGHRAHGAVSDEVAARVAHRVHQGMGLIVLHSGHFSKPFVRLMGTPCSLRWREAGERERLWATNPSHPILQGVGRIELASEEMYGEPFLVPEPMETLLISWFEGGEVFRSGLTWQRGAGRIFYFRPGHETYPTYHDPLIQQLLRNAVHWARNPVAWRDVADAPNVPPDRAPEKIRPRGPALHRPGEEGYR